MQFSFIAGKVKKIDTFERRMKKKSEKSRKNILFFFLRVRINFISLYSREVSSVDPLTVGIQGEKKFNDGTTKVDIRLERGQTFTQKNKLMRQ